MLPIVSKVKRCYEAADLIFRLAADSRSRLVLVSCYREILNSTSCQEEVELVLEFQEREFAITMRKSDLFTLGEVFHLRHYKLQSALPDRPTIVDAGANIGLATIWFLACYPGASLHAFEPETSNFRLLTSNLGHAENVSSIQAALGATNCQVILQLGDHAATHSIVPTYQPLDVGEEQETVRQLNLADYLQTEQVEAVDLLKLDVEGSELDVLRGLGDRIRMVRVICGEVHEPLVSPKEFFLYLERHGFAVLWRKYFRLGQDEGVTHFEAVRQ